MTTRKATLLVFAILILSACGREMSTRDSGEISFRTALNLSSKEQTLTRQVAAIMSYDNRNEDGLAPTKLFPEQTQFSNARLFLISSSGRSHGRVSSSGVSDRYLICPNQWTVHFVDKSGKAISERRLNSFSSAGEVIPANTQRIFLGFVDSAYSDNEGKRKVREADGPGGCQFQFRLETGLVKAPVATQVPTPTPRVVPTAYPPVFPDMPEDSKQRPAWREKVLSMTNQARMSNGYGGNCSPEAIKLTIGTQTYCWYIARNPVRYVTGQSCAQICSTRGGVDMGIRTPLDYFAAAGDCRGVVDAFVARGDLPEIKSIQSEVQNVQYWRKARNAETDAQGGACGLEFGYPTAVVWADSAPKFNRAPDYDNYGFASNAFFCSCKQ